MVISTLFLLMNHRVKSDCLQLSLFNMNCLTFCKSGTLISIFAENNYSIYAHAILIKIPLLHQSLGPRVFLSFFFLSFSLSLCLSVSIYFWLIPWNEEAGYVTQGILASLLLSLPHGQLRTTRFQSIKGPTAFEVEGLAMQRP